MPITKRQKDKSTLLKDFTLNNGATNPVTQVTVDLGNGWYAGSPSPNSPLFGPNGQVFDRKDGKFFDRNTGEEVTNPRYRGGTQEQLNPVQFNVLNFENQAKKAREGFLAVDKIFRQSNDPRSFYDQARDVNKVNKIRQSAIKNVGQDVFDRAFQMALADVKAKQATSAPKDISNENMAILQLNKFLPDAFNLGDNKDINKNLLRSYITGTGAVNLSELFPGGSQDQQFIKSEIDRVNRERKAGQPGISEVLGIDDRQPDGLYKGAHPKVDLSRFRPADFEIRGGQAGGDFGTFTRPDGTIVKATTQQEANNFKKLGFTNVNGGVTVHAATLSQDTGGLKDGYSFDGTILTLPNGQKIHKDDPSFEQYKIQAGLSDGNMTDAIQGTTEQDLAKELLNKMSKDVNWDTLSKNQKQEARPYGKLKQVKKEEEISNTLKSTLQLTDSQRKFLTDNPTIWKSYIEAVTYGGYTSDDVMKDLEERSTGKIGSTYGEGRGIINPIYDKEAWTSGQQTKNATSTIKGTQVYSGNIPFKQGMNDAQKQSINKLANKSDWDTLDLQNWNYATNSAPLPVGVTAPDVNVGKWVGINYNGKTFSGYIPGNKGLYKGKEDTPLTKEMIDDLFSKYQKRPSDKNEEYKYWEGKTAGDLEDVLGKTLIYPKETADRLREELKNTGQLFIRNQYELEQLAKAGIISPESVKEVTSDYNSMLFRADPSTGETTPVDNEPPASDIITGGDTSTGGDGGNDSGIDTGYDAGKGAITDLTGDLVGGADMPDYEAPPSPFTDLTGETDYYYDWVLNDLKAQTARDRTEARATYEYDSERASVNKARAIEQGQGSAASVGLYGSGIAQKANRQGVEEPYQDKFTDIRRTWFRGAAPGSEIDRLPESELRRLKLGLYTTMPDADMTDAQKAKFGTQYPDGFNQGGTYPSFINAEGKIVTPTTQDEYNSMVNLGFKIAPNGPAKKAGSPSSPAYKGNPKAPPQQRQFDGYLGFIDGKITTFPTKEEAIAVGATGVEPNYLKQPYSGGTVNQLNPVNRYSTATVSNQTAKKGTAQNPYPGQIGPYEAGNLGVYASDRDANRRMGYLTRTGVPISDLDVEYLRKKRKLEEQESGSIFKTKEADWKRRRNEAANPDYWKYTPNTPNTDIKPFTSNLSIIK